MANQTGPRATFALTDGGIETDIIFNKGVDLPFFSAFPLLDNAEGRDVLRAYYRDYLPVAKQAGRNFLFTTATWRASPDWAERLGYDRAALAPNNRSSVALCAEMAEEFAAQGIASSIAGLLGPRRDAWKFDDAMTADEAYEYHRLQIDAFAGTAATSVQCITLNNTPEAIGVARAAKQAGLPVVLAFTVETDGALPGGKSLGSAISEVDDATDGYTDYFMVNCAHPSHFAAPLLSGAAWIKRIGGLRANASTKSHAQLDESPEIDIGDIDALGRAHADILAALPNLRVVGGCCGTDHRHIAAICKHCQ
jgi:homocysteine S-methyltransferase